MACVRPRTSVGRKGAAALLAAGVEVHGVLEAKGAGNVLGEGGDGGEGLGEGGGREVLKAHQHAGALVQPLLDLVVGALAVDRAAAALLLELFLVGEGGEGDPRSSEEGSSQGT